MRLDGIELTELLRDAAREDFVPRADLSGKSIGAAAERLVECYLAGDSTYALSRRLGIRRETVSAHRRRHGIMRRVDPVIVLEPDQQARVVELYGAGLSMKWVADEMGVSERAVSRALDDACVRSLRHTLRSRGARRGR